MRFAARTALVLACILAATPVARSAETANVSALDFIELQIAYTTLLARYYVPVSPRRLVDGARTGIAADLVASGIDAVLPYTPQRVSAGDGGDLIDALVLRSLARYGMRVDPHRLIEAAIAGELAALHDPYTVLFRPASFRRFNAFLGNERFGGIGAVVSIDDASKRPRIERVLAGGPADAAGLRRGDVFTAIDGRAAGSSAVAVRDALRGKAGTAVRIEILRGDARLAFSLVRAEVRDPEVKIARFGDVGYAALARFGDRAGDEVLAALRDFKADGVRGVVLDLRDNGGGYGDEATAVASAFVTGPVFETRERTGPASTARATGHVAWSGPLVVLVNGETASAAEIVAGAIADDGAGTLVGTRTFGKGVVQSVFPLPDGSALKITTARYTTPKGRDIEGIGILPDAVVPEPAGSAEGDPATDPQLAAGLRILQARLAAVI